MFANAPEHYIRAFLLIQKDMQDLFAYVEPSEKNLQCHSYRIHELLFRACVEVEASCKAILLENGYPSNNFMKMNDYKKIEMSHKLSSYSVKMPIWHGGERIILPFEKWSTGNSLPWYDVYNNIKHNRYHAFEEATFDQMLNAVSGLVVILSSQFLQESFSPADGRLVLSHANVDFEESIGQFFRVKYPKNWPEEERYSFNWQELKDESDPFQNYPYPSN